MVYQAWLFGINAPFLILMNHYHQWLLMIGRVLAITNHDEPSLSIIGCCDRLDKPCCEYAWSTIPLSAQNSFLPCWSSGSNSGGRIPPFSNGGSRSTRPKCGFLVLSHRFGVWNLLVVTPFAIGPSSSCAFLYPLWESATASPHGTAAYGVFFSTQLCPKVRQNQSSLPPS